MFERFHVPATIIFDSFKHLDASGNVIYNNQVLISLFLGAALTGLGVGMALRHNGSTGGIDVIQKMISKYAKIPLSQTMYFTDWVIVIVAGLSFNPFTYNLEFVVYGSIAVIAEGFIIDYIALSLKPRRTVYVISDHPQQIKDFFHSFLKTTVPIQAPIIIPKELAINKIVNNIVLYFLIPNWSIQTGI